MDQYIIAYYREFFGALLGGLLTNLTDFPTAVLVSAP